MKNRNLILLLVEKSTNAFGQIIGLSEEKKLRTSLSITQSTIEDTLGINSIDLSKKTLGDILSKDLLSYEQAYLLTNLLWTQAEILLKLDQPQESLTHYKNALVVLRWKALQPAEKSDLEKKIKINELETVIVTMESKKR